MSELSQHAKLIKAIEIAKGAQVGIELSYFDVLEVAGELNEAKEVVAMLNARIAELEAAQRWIRTKVKLPDRAVREFYEVVCLHQDFAELALFSKGRWIIYEGTSVYDITDRVVFWRRRQPLPAEVMDVLNKRQELQ